MARFIATVEFFIDDSDNFTEGELEHRLQDALYLIENPAIDWQILCCSDVTDAWIDPEDLGEPNDPAVADSPGKDQEQA